MTSPDAISSPGDATHRTPRSRYAAKLDEFPDLILAGDASLLLRGNWLAHFRERIGPAFDGRLIVEIGCFDAGFLQTVAAKHPGTAFVGIDWKFRPIYEGAERIARARLKNILLLRGRAQELRRMFADHEVDELWIFHPDPCDKPNERANRLVTESFLLDAHAVLRDEKSSLVLKTDHPGYYQWVLSLLGEQQPPWFAEALADRGVTRRASPEAKSGDRPRVRAKDLVSVDQLPPSNGEVLRRLRVSANSPDFWSDPALLEQLSGRLFAGESTLFERRFVQKKLPIYFVELQPRKSAL